MYARYAVAAKVVQLSPILGAQIDASFRPRMPAWLIAPGCDIAAMEVPGFEYMRRIQLNLKEQGVPQPA